MAKQNQTKKDGFFLTTKNTFEEMPNSLVNFISVVSVIGSLISLGYTIVQIYLTYKNETEPIKLNSIILVISIAIIPLTAILIVRTFKYRAQSRNALNTFSESYDKACIELKKALLELSLIKKGDKNKKINCIKPHAIEIINCLSDIMCVVTRRQVSISLELIDRNEENMKKEVIERELKVFCRSRNADTRRRGRSSEKVLVKENYDAMYLETNSDNHEGDYFYVKKFETYHGVLKIDNVDFIKKTETHDSTKLIKILRGIITVPLRILNNQLANQNNYGYQHYGYLSVDSMSTNAFTKKQEEQNVDIIKTFASLLDVLLFACDT